MASVNDSDVLHSTFPHLEMPTTSTCSILPKYLSGAESTGASRDSGALPYTNGVDVTNQYSPDYDGHLEEALRASRVFIDIKDFLETVLRIPKDWTKQTALVDDIETVLQDIGFQNKLTKYLKSCKNAGPEPRLYEYRVDLYNRAFEILYARQSLAKPCHIYFRNDQKRLTESNFSKGLSPNLYLCAQAFRGRSLRYPQVLFLEKMTVTGNAIYDGQNVPHIMRDGCSRKSTTTQPKDVAMGEPGIYVGAVVDNPSSRPNCEATTTQALVDVKPPEVYLKGKKRAALESIRHGNQKRLKVVSTADSVSSGQHEIPQESINPQLRCARYATEQLSLSLLRSHFIMTICDLNRFQLQYYDRSIILVSSPADMGTHDGQRLFVLMVRGLLHLTPEDLGFRSIINGSNKFREDVDFYDSQTKKNWQHILSGMTLTTPIKSYTLGEVIFRQPGLIGRTTLVVRANGPDGPVVLKVTSATTSRVSEAELLRSAKKQATSHNGGTHWALNHLANQHETLDLIPTDDSIVTRVAHFLNTAKYADDKAFHYEARVLRIDVYEELHQLKTLTTVEDIAQVFYDVLQIHKWLYDFPAILHRDISMGNLMYRKVGDQVFGVLNDLDLSSLLSDIKSGNATSPRHTGTPPYMAYELQMPSDSLIVPLYRHDLESLFYVFCALVICHRFNVDGKDKGPNLGIYRMKDKERDDLGLATWFDLKSTPFNVANMKKLWFHGDEVPDFEGSIEPEFQPLLSCVLQIHQLFFRGAFLKKLARVSGNADAFDWETFSDMVTYAQFSKVMRAELPGPPKVRDDQLLTCEETVGAGAGWGTSNGKVDYYGYSRLVSYVYFTICINDY